MRALTPFIQKEMLSGIPFQLTGGAMKAGEEKAHGNGIKRKEGRGKVGKARGEVQRQWRNIKN